jgi:hypothetical protein
LPFLIVSGTSRTIVDGRYNDFPGGVLSSGGSNDCGIFNQTDDFHWTDRSCSSGLRRFLCGEIF